MEYKPTDIRMLSMLGQRGVFGTTLDRLAKDDEHIFALSADLTNTSGLDRYANNFPNRFINVGIAEQNMLGVAAGLADSGYKVFATTFANFASLRACEFVRHFMGYMQCPIKLIGFGAGFAMEFFGNTHYGIEDISALRAISNLHIISPADGLETAKATEALAKLDAPAYLRLSGMANNPVVYKEDYEFQIGKAISLKKGKNIGIIVSGSMVYYGLEAAKLLEEKGYSCSVLDMHTIKPLDEEAIDELLDSELLVTIEEHSTIGGLGSAVSEYISTKARAPKLLRLGVQQGYQKAGKYFYKLAENGLTTQAIADNILASLGR